MKIELIKCRVRNAETGSEFESNTSQCTLNAGEIVTFRGSDDGNQQFRILAAGFVPLAGGDGYFSVVAEPAEPNQEERLAEAEQKLAKRKLEDDAIYGNGVRARLAHLEEESEDISPKLSLHEIAASNKRIAAEYAHLDAMAEEANRRHNFARRVRILKR